ncbi:alkane hydroxylase MAH1-like [Brassica napus]|uniref:alkane hydroxylase MAH1-like n=1 Tax=Brassica napus TaxID=3708 RepID=UPI00207931C2|nr:alkane hydroxylase MAH1-like [Brassica napus]
MASALTWFFWLLSENPQVTTIIREEINKNLPRTGYDQENLDKLVYLHATLYETMRLYPPAPFQRKTSIKPDMLPSGHKVDANSTVIFFLYAMGRMRAIWGGRRMGVYSETGELRHEPSYKFFSFNAGPRTCLGKHTAMIHLMIIVVEILQNYDIEVVKGHKIEPLPGFILHMKHGLKVTFKKR